MIRGAALSFLAVVVGPAQAEPSPEARFRAMIDRPLFSPTRRPPPPPLAPLEAPATPDPPPSRPDLSLSGVIVGGGGGLALVRRPQDAAPLRVALGSQIDGWTLAEVRARAIVLRRDGREVTVDLAPP